ncbi:MAG: methionyl-tRNA formyltransferase [Pseudomonadota bacterium]
MRLVFMGSPDFAVPALDALVEAGHEVACVYCQPPRPAGRGKKDRKTRVHMRAEELGLPVRHPASLRNEEAQREFAALQADVAIVAAYGLILPKPILDAPRMGCINIHASLLPRWRGAAPIHRAVMARDPATGICIMFMEEGLDTGPVLLRAQTPIGIEETTGQLHDRLAALGAKMVAAVLDWMPLWPEAQAQDGATYAEKISKDEARVDWARPGLEVDAHIRGLSPFPGAWCEIGGKRVKLLASRFALGSGAPGDVLSGLTIACGEEAVEITRLQVEGKRPVSAEDFLRGADLPRRLT